MSKTAIRWIDVCTLASGAALRIAVHEIGGAPDGPTLGVSALLHGDEITGPEVIRRLLDRIDPSRLRGRLRLVPVANPLAFQTLTRSTPLAVEIANLNRVFPADPSLDLPARVAPVARYRRAGGECAVRIRWLTYFALRRAHRHRLVSGPDGAGRTGDRARPDRVPEQSGSAG